MLTASLSAAQDLSRVQADLPAERCGRDHDRAGASADGTCAPHPLLASQEAVNPV